MSEGALEPRDPMAGRSVLVAGATGGLGSAIARNLSLRGATLTMVSRRHDVLAALDVPGFRLALDLRDPEACDAAVRAAVEHTGKLDVVVNAVGVVAFGPVEELSVDTMEELFMTNTFVPILLAKAALGALGQGGVMVNISGVIAERNLPGMAAYGASKAADAILRRGADPRGASPQDTNHRRPAAPHRDRLGGSFHRRSAAEDANGPRSGRRCGDDLRRNRRRHGGPPPAQRSRDAAGTRRCPRGPAPRGGSRLTA